jgi:hypothetical protein
MIPSTWKQQDTSQSQLFWENTDDVGDCLNVDDTDAPSTSASEVRKGKWTPEEEDYAAILIEHFDSGLLSLPEGTTLRVYLAEQLNCDPMRITKKFTGQDCLGKRVSYSTTL